MAVPCFGLRPADYGSTEYGLRSTVLTSPRRPTSHLTTTPTLRWNTFYGQRSTVSSECHLRSTVYGIRPTHTLTQRSSACHADPASLPAFRRSLLSAQYAPSHCRYVPVVGGGGCVRVGGRLAPPKMPPKLVPNIGSRGGIPRVLGIVSPRY